MPTVPVDLVKRGISVMAVRINVTVRNNKTVTELLDVPVSCIV